MGNYRQMPRKFEKFIWSKMDVMLNISFWHSIELYKFVFYDWRTWENKEKQPSETRERENIEKKSECGIVDELRGLEYQRLG